MAKMFSQWGLLWMLHTPMECLRAKGEPKQKPGSAAPPAGREGWPPKPSTGPSVTYLLLVNTDVPGVLVSQPFRRPSSPPAWRQKQPLMRKGTDGCFSGTGFMSVRKLPQVAFLGFQAATGRGAPETVTPVL